MSEIDAYLSSLRKLELDLDKIVNDIIRKNEKYILSMIKLRLWNYGIDAAGKKILPDYKESTKKAKKEDGKRSSHVTLRDEGDFYRSMIILFDGNKILISATDDVTGILINKYGVDILGLTIQEQRTIIDTIIEPEIIKIVNALPNINL